MSIRIQVRGVSYRAGGHAVLDHLDLEVGVAESVAIVGRSGSGKTTLLRILAGLDQPDAGWITFGERPVNAPGLAVAPWLRGLGMVFQSSALWPHFTVAQNIAFALQDRPSAARRDRTATMLASLGLQALADRYPHQISGGEARRIALARAMAAEPDILLLDEALTNVDSDTKVELVELIRSIARGKATMVVVTHDLNEAAELSDRVLRLADGRLTPWQHGPAPARPTAL